jgi:cyclophilin family peptidyl-prolyl cis-trans isomerase
MEGIEMKLKAILLTLLLPALMLVQVGCGGDSESVDTPILYPKTTPEPTPTPIPEREAYIHIDQNYRYIATITTNYGSIEIELFTTEAPKTVNNFVTLSKDGYYNGLIFHRVIPNFMIQGGDPTGTGTGGPGYTFEDEFHTTLKFDKPGFLAMANAGPNTNGSQFFITTVPTAQLTGRHTIFGRVLEGQDVVEVISRVHTSVGDRPIQDVKIQGIQIEETPRE